MRCFFFGLFLLWFLPSLSAMSVTGQEISRSPAFDAEELPVSMDRIRRQLERLPPNTDGETLLELSYYVEVYGLAPQIDIIRDFDVRNGPVPYSAPTHTEMITVMTPRLYRVPTAFSIPVIGWSRKGH